MQQYHIHLCTNRSTMFLEVEEQPRTYAGFVEAESLEEAYLKSQNGHEEWNPTNPCRSCSVGDIIQDDNSFFMVLGCGFINLITKEEVKITSSDKSFKRFGPELVDYGYHD